MPMHANETTNFDDAVTKELVDKHDRLFLDMDEALIKKGDIGRARERESPSSSLVNFPCQNSGDSEV